MVPPGPVLWPVLADALQDVPEVVEPSVGVLGVDLPAISESRNRRLVDEDEGVGELVRDPRRAGTGSSTSRPIIGRTSRGSTTSAASRCRGLELVWPWL